MSFVTESGIEVDNISTSFTSEEYCIAKTYNGLTLELTGNATGISVEVWGKTCSTKSEWYKMGYVCRDLSSTGTSAIKNGVYDFDCSCLSKVKFVVSAITSGTLNVYLESVT